MTGQNKKITGILLTLLGGAFWGISGACGQYLFEYKGATSEWLVPVRLLLAGYVMLAFFLIKDRKTTLSVWRTKKNALDIIFYGLAGMMMCQYTYFRCPQAECLGTAICEGKSQPITKGRDVIMTIQKKHFGALEGDGPENMPERGSKEQTSKCGPDCTGYKSKVSTNLIGLVSADFTMLKAAEEYCDNLPNINILFY